MSYLADPPETPIQIDGGVEYTYVIAQQGALSVTAPTIADWTLSVSMGDPAILRIKYTGSTSTVPIYQIIDLTVNWQDGSPSSTHSPQFMVLETSASQRVPNITSAVKLYSGLGGPVDFTIQTDISADSFNAVSLPGTLAINTTTGRITGTAPSSDSFNAIILQANKGTYHYKRYIVLVVGTGASNDHGTFGGPPPNTTGRRVTLDGDYTEAQIADMPQYENPFLADPKPYLYRLKYWQLFADFSEPAIGSAGPFGGFYVGGASGSIRNIGGGVIEFERQYALVPDSRSEYESHVYDYHLVFYTLGFPNFCTQGTPLNVHSRLQYDYFKTDDPNSINLPRAPQLLQTCLGYVQLDDFPSTATPSGTEILAEDATFKIWKPGIYERRMRFIRWISSVDLLFNNG